MKHFRILVLILVAVFSGLANGGEKVLHEGTEWTDVYVKGANKKDARRVLMVGDSIASGYFWPVNQRLKGVDCARYLTSAFVGHEDFIEGLRRTLRRYRFEVIHLNNGLHGMFYTEKEFEAGLKGLVDMIEDEGRGAKIVMALSTPVRVKGSGELNVKRNARIKKRNGMMREIAKRRGFEVSDLYTLCEGQRDFYKADMLHFNGKGMMAQGVFVAGVLNKALAETQVKYETGFEDGAVAWGFLNKGCWKVEDVGDGRKKALRLYRGHDGFKNIHGLKEYGILKGRSVGDFVLDVKVRRRAEDVCLIFGYQDSANYYYVRLVGNDSSWRHGIYRVHGGVEKDITLKQVVGAGLGEGWDKVRVRRVVSKGYIAVYVGGGKEPVVIAKDMKLRWGRIGFGGDGTVADFDDFKLVGERGDGGE